MAKAKILKKEKKTAKIHPTSSLKYALHFAQKHTLPILLSIILSVLLFSSYQMAVADKFYPFTFIGDTNITFLTYPDSLRKVEATFNKRAQGLVQFNKDQLSFDIDLATSSAKLDYSEIAAAFSQSRSGNFWQRLKSQFIFLIYQKKITPKITLSLEKQLDSIASVVDKEAKNAELIFDEVVNNEGTPSARIQIKEDVYGLALDKKELEKNIVEYLLSGKYTDSLPVKSTPPKVTTAHVMKAKKVLEKVQAEPIILTFNQDKWTVDTKQLLTLLDLTSGGEALLDKDKSRIYITKVAQEIDRQVQEGQFEFNPQTKRVSAFKPSHDGQKLDIDKTYELINTALSTEAPHSIPLPVTTVKPKVQTQDVNHLGIKELIGRGVSNFTGSIANRIYNISLSASRINGVLIAPGEEFSFNNTVGEISGATGYRQAYVINAGRTVLDDGGGVCQTSTTVFRAVLNAGLPVVARTAHAYRVTYYEQGFPVGLDATIFSPTVDFKFKNETGHHILIQAYATGHTLYVDLYGTSDGRTTILSTPVVTNRTPPPEPLYQDDPTLPKGEVKQVDWAASGANVSFNRTVMRGGQELIKETWRSNYRPWQAIYLVGTKEN